jgi:hypothetical protein
MRKPKIKSIAWSLALAFLLLSLGGCAITTPEIKGLVLDEETKQPVEGAWVHAGVWVKTKTFAGDVGQVRSLDSPHTRTGKDGRFIISDRIVKTPYFPYGLGSQVTKFSVGAATLDKSGKQDINVEEINKGKVEVIIYLEDVDKVWEKENQHIPPERLEEARERNTFSALQGLYQYCLTGRSSVEVPAVKEGCDEWELDFAIKKHERYLEKYWSVLRNSGDTILISDEQTSRRQENNFRF